jgi:hypothetical protein
MEQYSVFQSCLDKEGRMSDKKARAGKPGASKDIDEQIASLMEQLQKEAVPERLLELALQLQKALNARTK